MIKKIVSVVILILLLVSILTLAYNIQPVKASGTIYIRADGSIDPPTAPITTTDNVTYTFTGNISDEIVVERSNIIIEGDGCTLQGSGIGYGFTLSGITNVTAKNTNIKNFDCGVFLWSSSNSMVSGNNITNNNWYGVCLYSSSNNNITGNNITNNNGYGALLYYSSNNRFYHNNFINNTYQVYLIGSFNNTWDNGCEGNYWNDYNGSDSDGDGIGDTPYIIDTNNNDSFPLMNPYWLPGDINHDLIINIYDVVRITGIYGSEQGDPNWNCHSDIAEPYGIIDIYDVVTCTKDYRKEYTP